MTFTPPPEFSDDLIKTFRSLIPTKPEDWQLVGIVNRDKDVFTFGNDSKIIGRAFEVVAALYVKKLAEKLRYSFHESTSQTVYPDFYLGRPDGKRIAIDVKSTYRSLTQKGLISPFRFTLGSFTSYLRDGKKNIDGLYSDYAGHYVLAFLYSRTNRFDTLKVGIDEIDRVPPSFDRVEVIFMEKYRIGGDKTGSGNTDNLATFSATSTEPFKYGAGPFAVLGESVFEHYWRHHPRNRDTAKVKASLYKNLPDYFDWLERTKNSSFDVKKLRENYGQYKKWLGGKGWDIRLN